MLREDLQLRRAARSGDAAASLELARRLFTGSSDRANYTMGLAYIRGILQTGCNEAKLLTARYVPLDVLAAEGVVNILHDLGDTAGETVRVKLGLWLALRQETRRQGCVLLNLQSEELTNPLRLLQIMKETDERVLGSVQHLAMFAAKQALEEKDLLDASYCVRVASGTEAPSEETAAFVATLVERAAATASGGEALHFLPPEFVGACLEKRAEAGYCEALFVLGCGFSGRCYGSVPASRLTYRINHRKAVEFFFRATDRGSVDAWLELHFLLANYRSSASNSGLAIFCLEKAAEYGVPVARRMLAVFRLGRAKSIRDVEAAVAQMHSASECGDGIAKKLLQSFVLPAGEMSDELRDKVLAQAAKVDDELAVRLRLARRFRLTKEETFGPLKAAFRPWGLVLMPTSGSVGRSVPAANEEMENELSFATSFFQNVRSIEDTLIKQRRKLNRALFLNLHIAEDEFFSRALGGMRRYSFGEPWLLRIKEEFLLTEERSARHQGACACAKQPPEAAQVCCLRPLRSTATSK